MTVRPPGGTSIFEPQCGQGVCTPGIIHPRPGGTPDRQGERRRHRTRIEVRLARIGATDASRVVPWCAGGRKPAARRAEDDSPRRQPWGGGRQDDASPRRLTRLWRGEKEPSPRLRSSSLHRSDTVWASGRENRFYGERTFQQDGAMAAMLALIVLPMVLFVLLLDRLSLLTSVSTMALLAVATHLGMVAIGQGPGLGLITGGAVWLGLVVTIPWLVVVTVRSWRRLARPSRRLHLGLLAALVGAGTFFWFCPGHLACFPLADRSFRHWLERRVDVAALQRWAEEALRKPPDQIERGEAGMLRDTDLPADLRAVRQNVYLSDNERQEGRHIRITWGWRECQWGLLVGPPTFRAESNAERWARRWRDGVYGYRETEQATRPTPARRAWPAPGRSPSAGRPLSRSIG